MIPSRGFTLVEMAMAVAILALLLFAAMVPFSTQVDVRNVADTRRTMDSIKDAIVGFTQANGRLPCPANGAISAGTAGAGVEQSTGTPSSCTSTFGVIPWVTLGVPETDAWGRRFSYWVSPIFADAPPNAVAPPPPPAVLTFNSPGQTPDCSSPNPQPTQSSFALCSLGVLGVSTRSETSHSPPTALGAGLPLVFISHGKNGSGAYIPTGGILPAPAGADETANSTGNRPVGANPFISRIPTQSASGCNDAVAGGTFCAYDDIVASISASTLVARMVAAGKLP
jgi:prepilin-type N-terminal cleavage/methylation domain-containing protein